MYEKGINLTKIESTPNKGKPCEYIFFIDFEGHAAEPHVAEAFDEVKGLRLFVKLLGSYWVKMALVDTKIEVLKILSFSCSYLIFHLNSVKNTDCPKAFLWKLYPTRLQAEVLKKRVCE